MNVKNPQAFHAATGLLSILLEENTELSIIPLVVWCNRKANDNSYTCKAPLVFIL